MRRSRKRPYADEHPELDVSALMRGGARTESGSDGQWSVHQVRTDAKVYTCSGCGRPIELNAWHLVAFRTDHLFGDEAGLSERRHWHEACWRARGRRR